jgi:hypothetical protein
MAAIYGYRCSWCGPFDRRGNPRAAGAPAVCPTCGDLAARTYEAPGGRGPRRARQLDGVGPAGRARIERAETGVPRTGPMPAGRRATRAGPAPPKGRAHAAGRPWQIGH